MLADTKKANEGEGRQRGGAEEEVEVGAEGDEKADVFVGEKNDGMETPRPPSTSRETSDTMAGHLREGGGQEMVADSKRRR